MFLYERNSKMTEKKETFNEPDQRTRAAARPLQEVLEEVVAKIDSPEKAEALLNRLILDTEGMTAEEAAPIVLEAVPEEQVKEAARLVQAAAEAEEDEIARAAAALEAVAAESIALEGESYEALTDAIQEVSTPSIEETPEKLSRPRRLLLDAILRQPGISLASKLDTEIFVLINILIPRSRRIDRFFHRLSAAFTGGWIYLFFIAMVWPFNRRWAKETLLNVTPPLMAATLIVEGPIKQYFRRRRPFIDVVRTIVIGKKPGNWSFPSGHASSSFGGAYIVGKYIPALRPVVYSLAALVAFSRIYLGAHYPGDVVTGSLVGIGLAKLTDWLTHRYWRAKKR
jgi:membrane-associated phospholipid phosphatase